jgi:hypothetical protein
MADDKRVSIFINDVFVTHQDTVAQGRELANNLRNAFAELDAQGLCPDEAKVRLVTYRESKKL